MDAEAALLVGLGFTPATKLFSLDKESQLAAMKSEYEAVKLSNIYDC